MTHTKSLIFIKAALLWAVLLIIGAVGGWSVSFFGYGILPISCIYGWYAGKVFMKLGGHNPTVAALLVFSSGIIARLGVGAYLLKQSDTPIPPDGAWQTITDMFIPWPIPALALFAIAIAVALSIRHSLRKQTRGINPCEQHSHPSS